MESQPQNPEFRNNPGNFHPCLYGITVSVKIKIRPERLHRLSASEEI